MNKRKRKESATGSVRPNNRGSYQQYTVHRPNNPGSYPQYMVHPQQQPPNNPGSYQQYTVHRPNNPGSYPQYTVHPQQQPQLKIKESTSGSVRPNNSGSYSQSTVHLQQQPPPTLPTTIEGIKEITVEDVFATLDDLPQLEQPLLNIFDDDFFNFDKFDIDSSQNDAFFGNYSDNSLFPMSSPALPSSSSPTIIPQPDTVSQDPLATVSSIDTTVLPPVSHEFSPNN